MLPFTKLRHITLLTTQLLPPTHPTVTEKKQRFSLPTTGLFLALCKVPPHKNRRPTSLGLGLTIAFPLRGEGLGELSAGLLSWLRLLAGGGLYPAYAVEHLLLKISRFSDGVVERVFLGGASWCGREMQKKDCEQNKLARKQLTHY